MLLQYLQFATVAFGSICVAMSLGLFYHFSRSRRPIGRAVAYMLLGEAVGAGVAIVFSISGYGVFSIMTPEVALALRWVMFGTAFLTSLHLSYQTWVIETRGDGLGNGGE